MAQLAEAAVASTAQTTLQKAIQTDEALDDTLSIFINRVDAHVNARLSALSNTLATELKSVQSEFVKAIQNVQDDVTKTRRSGIDLARQMTEVVADSHNKQISAMNDILQQLTVGEQTANIHYKDLRRDIPGVNFWNFVAEKLLALESKWGPGDVDAEGEPDVTELQDQSKTPGATLETHAPHGASLTDAPGFSRRKIKAVPPCAPDALSSPMRRLRTVSSLRKDVNGKPICSARDPYPSPVSHKSQTPTGHLPGNGSKSSISQSNAARKWISKKKGNKGRDSLKRRRSSTTASDSRPPSITGIKRKKYDVDWLPHIAVEEGCKPSLIKCDQCDSWYHTVCAGMDEKSCDIESMVFVCQRCVTNGRSSTFRRSSGRRLNHSGNACSRPDCRVPSTKSKLMIQSEEEFVIEAIIGRRRCPYPFPEVTWQYLLKWE
ncbi:uncharacterized protein EI90DRAFT_3150093, partial [Cantharellus anzutake]|uniref:uncharacterized protein n=1 Tax=Cantharellus anzutake TaxID=1750568 RepID=UPI0019062361